MTAAVTLPPGYEDALHREAQAATAKLGADRKNRRLGRDEKPDRKDIRNEWERMTDKALVEHGKAIIEAASPLEEYMAAVTAGYGNTIKTHEAKSLAIIAHRYGLNPAPGLDLVYGWYQNNQFKIMISYKGWLALAHRFKQFVYRFQTLPEDEVKRRGNPPGTIVVICQSIDMGVARMVAELNKLGFNEEKPDDYKLIGVGVALPNDQAPKGRDREWLAKKRATKDMAVQLLAEVFNINPPNVPDAEPDTDGDAWVVKAREEAVTEALNPQIIDMVIDGEWSKPEDELKAAAETPETPAVKAEPEAAPDAPEAPASVSGDEAAPTTQADNRAALSASDLQVRFNQWRNTELEKKNPTDRDDIGKDGAESLLSQFDDIADKPTARNFVIHLTGRELVERVKVMERRIIQEKILNVPDRAKTEIESYVNVHNLGTQKAQKPAASTEPVAEPVEAGVK